MNSDEIPFCGFHQYLEVGECLQALVPGVGMLTQRWPHGYQVMAAAWVSPELSASYLSRTQAGARQGTALLGENGAETNHPVGMRPIYFPFTHHTWDQPGGG